VRQTNIEPAGRGAGTVRDQPGTGFRLPLKGFAAPDVACHAESGNHSRWSELAMVRPTVAHHSDSERPALGLGRSLSGAQQFSAEWREHVQDRAALAPGGNQARVTQHGRVLAGRRE
jgi:hypothetical protein